jgi:radical SAM protein with 4Fe4S-binding SPASM domain
MNKIVCRWLEKKRLVVNPDGQVHPCCYFANYHYIQTHQNKDNFEKFWENPSMELFKDYHNDKDDLNIHKKSMKEILSHDWFSKKLPDSWKEQNTRHEICIRFCQTDKDSWENDV